MLPSPRIIVIDDNPGHLRGLADGLNSYGVACLQVLFTGDVEGIRECPHVCVVFLDKNAHLNAAGEVRDVDALVEALASIVQDQPQIAALLNWEERVLGASAGTVSAMIELAIAGLR